MYMFFNSFFCRKPLWCFSALPITTRIFLVICFSVLHTFCETVTYDDDAKIEHFRHRRLVGGTSAKLSDWPFFAVIFKNGSLHCGATVLREDLILTAGRCFPLDMQHDELTLYKVCAGVKDCHDPNAAEQCSNVCLIKRSSQFSMGDHPDNDIAILKLKQKLKYSNNIDNVTLPVKGSAVPSVGARCKLAGCGSLSYAERTPAKEFQELPVEITSDKECNEDKKRKDINLSSQFCAARKGFVGPHREDIGDPMVCYYSGKAILYGIVSWIKRCNSDKCTTVFTRIPNQMQWINTRLRNFWSGVETCAA